VCVCVGVVLTVVVSYSPTSRFYFEDFCFLFVFFS
jgi:hypothetical protein